MAPDLAAARWVARMTGADWDGILRVAHAQATACRRRGQAPPAAVAVIEREYWRRRKQLQRPCRTAGSVSAPVSPVVAERNREQLGKALRGEAA